MVQTFRKDQPHNGLPILLPDHVVDHDILGCPAIPFLTVLALGAMMVFLCHYPITYYIGWETGCC